MRTLARSIAVVATLGAGLVTFGAATPAAAEGKCVDVYVHVWTPPPGATVCTPDI